MTVEKMFSIILPVCHGGNFLYHTLASLHKLDFPSHQFEVIVVGSLRDEQSRGIVTEAASSADYSMTYIQCPEDNRSSKLNAGCAAARGRCLAFADDDCIFERDWLQQIDHILSHQQNVGVIGGRDVLVSNNSSFSLALDYVLNSFLGTGGLRNRLEPQFGRYYPRLWNMAIPYNVAMDAALKDNLETPQIFNESLIVHEDVDIVTRIEHLGKRIVFAPELRLGHSRDTTFASFFKRNFAMARTSRLLGVHRLPHAALAAFFVVTFSLALGSFFWSTLCIVPASLVGIYFSVLLIGSLAGLRKTKNLRVFALIPILLTSLHVARGLGYLFPWNATVPILGKKL